MKTFSAETRQRMRESSRKRWDKKEERLHLSELRSAELPMQQVADLYEAGYSMKQLGKRFGVHAQTICRRMKLAGIPARNKGHVFPRTGPNHHNWLGDSASYSAFHQRLNRLHGTAKKCTACGSTDDPGVIYEWANLSGNYWDLLDYKRLCRPCHRKYDSGFSREEKRARAAARKTVRGSTPRRMIPAGVLAE